MAASILHCCGTSCFQPHLKFWIFREAYMTYVWQTKKLNAQNTPSLGIWMTTSCHTKSRSDSIKPYHRAACPLPNFLEVFKEIFQRMIATQDISNIDNKQRNTAAAEPSTKVLHLLFKLPPFKFIPVSRNRTRVHARTLHAFL